MATKKTDPMSGIPMFRLTGPPGSKVYRVNSAGSLVDTGFVFPQNLSTENLPDTNKVWNADGSLLMIDRSFRPQR